MPRPEGGATSDHWSDVAELEFEPLFFQHVRDAFNPVGVMLDFWAQEVESGSERDVQIYVINDTYAAWQGDVRLLLVAADRSETLKSKRAEVDALGRKILTFQVTMPAETAPYTLIAELRDPGGETVQSRRKFRVK